jgi:RNA polymerase sigma-70 factor, ECF subfamily
VSQSRGREQLEDDSLLVVRVGEGDAKAYRELVRRHAEKLHHYALRLLRNSADAEDVIQDTFLRLWLRATDYMPTARVATWLHRITHNLALDRLRSRKYTEELADESELAHIPESQSDQLETKRDAEALHQALDALPSRQAAALVLVHLNGLSGKEASEVLGVGEAAIESLLARARRNLKAQMDKLPSAGSGDSQ